MEAIANIYIGEIYQGKAGLFPVQAPQYLYHKCF